MSKAFQIIQAIFGPPFSSLENVSGPVVESDVVRLWCHILWKSETSMKKAPSSHGRRPKSPKSPELMVFGEVTDVLVSHVKKMRPGITPSHHLICQKVRYIVKRAQKLSKRTEKINDAKWKQDQWSKFQGIVDLDCEAPRTNLQDKFEVIGNSFWFLGFCLKFIFC